MLEGCSISVSYECGCVVACLQTKGDYAMNDITTTKQIYPASNDNMMIYSTFGLMELIQTAVGRKNFENIHPSITTERFKLVNSARKGNLDLVPFLDGETGYQATKRLVPEGFKLENTGELAKYMINNLAEIQKYAAVLALSDDSQWECLGGGVYVPYAHALARGRRSFSLYDFFSKFNSRYHILVSR